ncbi:hypothetical protein P9112_012394 [Eukaryota sp. TZLM1-RC]
MDHEEFRQSVSRIALENARSITATTLERSLSPHARSPTNRSRFNPDDLLDSLANEITDVISDIRIAKTPTSSPNLPSPSFSSTSEVSPSPQSSSSSPKSSPHNPRPLNFISSPSSSPPQRQLSMRRISSNDRSSIPLHSPKRKTSPPVNSAVEVSTTSEKVHRKKLNQDQFEDVMKRWSLQEQERQDRLAQLRKAKEEQMRKVHSNSPRINKKSEQIAGNRVSVFERNASDVVREKKEKYLKVKLKKEEEEEKQLRKTPKLSKMATKIGRRGIQAQSEWEEQRQRSIEEKRKTLEEQEKEGKFKPKITRRSEQMMKKKGEKSMDRLINSRVRSTEPVKIERNFAKDQEISKRAHQTCNRLYQLGVDRLKKNSETPIQKTSKSGDSTQSIPITISFDELKDYKSLVESVVEPEEETVIEIDYSDFEDLFDS